MQIDKKAIEAMSYTDFIWFINQWNVLPGAFSTLSRRINYSNINKSSNVLEVWCTTWFSIREVSTLTWCKWVWLDISQRSIDAAILNQKEYSTNNQIKYICEDAYQFKSNDKFSHIIVWGWLKFFPDQEMIIKKLIELMLDWGYILASPFYVTSKIPGNLIDEAKSVFWINITTETYKEIMKLYNKFEIIYENRLPITQETEEEINYYAKCTIDRVVKTMDIEDTEVYNCMLNRLISIKNMSNMLRPFQEYSVLVLRYREKIYPNRFIELF